MVGLGQLSQVFCAARFQVQQRFSEGARAPLRFSHRVITDDFLTQLGLGLVGRGAKARVIGAHPLEGGIDHLGQVGQLRLGLVQVIGDAEFHIADLNPLRDAVVGELVGVELGNRLRRDRDAGEVNSRPRKTASVFNSWNSRT